MTRRLLLVAPVPPPIGGIATFARWMLDGPVGARWEIEVVDASVVANRAAGAAMAVKRVAVSARVLAEVVAALRHEPDVAHVCCPATGVGVLRAGVIAALAWARGVPALIHVHGRLEGVLDHPRFGRVAVAALRRARVVVVLDRRTVSRLGALGIEARWLGNAVGRRPTAPRPARDGLRVVQVGWVCAEKGVFDLLEAVARVDGVQLHLVGRVVEDAGRTVRARVEARASRPDLAGRVALVGEVAPDAVGACYDAADALALASHSEGLPYVILEAMMAGLPVVATDVGGVPEAVVNGVTGVLVPVGDIDALAAALRTLRDDPERRAALGAAGHARAVDLFGDDAVADALQEIYAALG